MFIYDIIKHFLIAFYVVITFYRTQKGLFCLKKVKTKHV